MPDHARPRSQPHAPPCDTYFFVSWRLGQGKIPWQSDDFGRGCLLYAAVLSDPPPLAPRIEYQKHKDTIPEFLAMLPGVKPEDFPDGEAAAAEWVRLTTHSGTHLDAPWHFHLTMNKGERSITCFPHKIRGASAGWTRAVAIFDDALSTAH